ncbi:MAG: transcriptional regulator [Patescibacteria group bacterium]
MVEQLFGSKTRVKLLQLFYNNPNRAFYVREITRKIDEQINSVRRELANLLSIGIISSETNNNRLYYEVNQNFEHFAALASIFGGVKLTKKTTIKDVDEVDIKTIGNIELAFYTGQFTRDETSGVDIIIVGDVNQTQLSNFIEDLEKRENKDLRYVVMAPKEFTYRRQINDRFIGLALTSKKQILIDKQHVLDEK